jgi:3-methyl-2-oxobutanoate hydroxymethyltransferase
MKKPERITVPDFQRMKSRRERIVAVTCYDASFARLCDRAGADILLVGDSLGMVVQGLDTTLPVTLDDVLYHTRAVVRGAERAHVVADMPFLSYQVSIDEAVRNAGRLLQGGAHAVKLEGGVEVAPAVRRMVAVGIPVMGHVGLTPQSVHAMGGFRLQGRDEASQRRILEDARALQEAGSYSIVIEGIPLELAQKITEEVAVPTIGIGAGPHCDGQVLVLYDLLGLDEEFRPRFVKQYETLGARVRDAVGRYAGEVRAGEFPAAEHSVSKRREKA